jgi:tetratricopeptide (TPR) repeat protein
MTARILLFQRTMPFVALLLFAALSRPAHAADDARSAARESYARGVELANAGDYQRALAEFERAYELSPHYAVLYNIAQAERAIGHSEQALQAFESYLRLGTEQIPAERRLEVETAIAALKKERASETPEPPPQPAAPAPAPAPIVVAPEPLPRQSGAPASVPSAPGAEPSGGAQRTLGYALGILGLGLGGAAIAHWRWNDGRYDDWKAAYDAYQEQSEPGAIDALNERSQSIERASRVSVGLGIGAAVSFGAGAVLLLTSGGSSRSTTTGMRPCAVGGFGLCSRW